MHWMGRMGWVRWSTLDVTRGGTTGKLLVIQDSRGIDIPARSAPD